MLAPLADLAPDLEPPGWGESVAQAREHAREAEGPTRSRPSRSGTSAAFAGWTSPRPLIPAPGDASPTDAPKRTKVAQEEARLVCLLLDGA